MTAAPPALQSIITLALCKTMFRWNRKLMVARSFVILITFYDFRKTPNKKKRLIKFLATLVYTWVKLRLFCYISFLMVFE